MTQLIELKKIERDCVYNKKHRARNITRGLIYDFDIFIDHERRGQWRNTSGGGVAASYDLVDADGDMIPNTTVAGSHVPFRVGRQSDLLKATERILLMDVFPTEEQLREKREVVRRQKEEYEKRQAEADVLRRKERAAPKLYEVLVCIRTGIREGYPDSRLRDKLLELANEALREADGP